MANYLSLNEINESCVEKCLKLPVIHNKDWWEEIDLDIFPQPIRLEFNETITERMPVHVKTHKGIYMFFIEPNHPFEPDIKHLMYVGRVQSGSTSFNFYKRFYDYVKCIGNKSAQINRQLLTNAWPNYTYVYFYCFDNKTDEEISHIEQVLYNKIVPPLNNNFEGKARQTRNLY
ncbi:MAG: hypothetical protein LBV67_10645 [Streptococcaceae bacterium]|jgi:hypothetical protein|nr:hypothetical protein [Streptococcaceae bacterium]